MRQFLLYLAILGIIVVSITTAAALWSVRSYLPLVGVFLLTAFGIAICLLLVWLIVYVKNSHEIIHRGDVVVIRQGKNFYHASAYHVAAGTPTKYIEAAPTRVVETDPILALPAPLIPRLPVAPSVNQIASQIAPGHLILGYGMQGAIYGDVTDLLSTAIVGRPNTGKTTMLRLVCAQILQIGGMPLLLDPHGSIVDELGDFLDCAESGQEITELTSWVEEELEERLIARRQGSPMKQPILLLADEWPIISQLSPDALQPVRRLVLEGRKVGMYALICGQGLPAQLLGGTLVRDALASRYVFNTTPQQARLAGLDNETAKTMLAQLQDAGAGKAILATSKRRPELVAIPAIESNDLRRLVSGNAGNRRETDGNDDEEPIAKNVFPFPSQEQPSSEEQPSSVGNDIRETIKRMNKKGIALRDIAKFVGLSGRKYPIFQEVCKQEGIAGSQVEA